jgi:hypothetical protein
MELTNFLAQLFGLTIAIFAGIAVLQPGMIRVVVREFGESTMVTLLFGTVGIMGGLAVVLSHNLWVADWPVLVTLLGWSALVKGMVTLASPALLHDMGESIYSSPGRTQIILVIAGILGIYLAGAGFGLL